MPDFRITSGGHVGRMLDGESEGACIFCSVLAPVPECVLAVVQHGGRQRPVIVCEPCSQKLLVVMPLAQRLIDSLLEERDS
jgi:hypothetical protein